MQGVINLIGASYNIKRIFNICCERIDVFNVMYILTALSSNFLYNPRILQHMNNVQY